MNKRKRNVTSRKYIGVYKRKDSKWDVIINHKGKKHKYGPFNTEDFAARQYDRWSRYHCKNNLKKKLNFPIEQGDEELISNKNNISSCPTKKRKISNNPLSQNYSYKECKIYDRKNISLTIRNRVCRNQKWNCNLCNERLSATIIIDHIIPLFLNGVDNISNYQALCPDCEKYKTKHIDRQSLSKYLKENKKLTPKIGLDIQKKHYDDVLSVNTSIYNHNENKDKYLITIDPDNTIKINNIDNINIKKNSDGSIVITS